ncbi:hypothetical protein PIB30_085839 [Stylosanthes scabra]|uniref:Uncharacterized protein n=1 Tax=Stylosanthes scabra TaxID=79078 RepID=A0ABU6ZRK0_9FABA|nr:hypothetical protein [Stylosanthes scabra]
MLNGHDSVIDDIINCSFNGYNEMVGADLMQSRMIDVVAKRAFEEPDATTFKCDELGYDPMILEAHLGIKEKVGPMLSLGLNNPGPTKCVDYGSGSSNTCPYPPGFGPCALSGHLHRTEGRVADSHVCVRETPLEASVRKAAQPSVDEVPAKNGVFLCSPTIDSEFVSSDTLYCINWDRIEGTIQSSDEIATRVIGGDEDGSTIQRTIGAGNGEEEASDETLYRINPDVVGCNLADDGMLLEDDDAGGDVNEENKTGAGDHKVTIASLYNDIDELNEFSSEAEDHSEEMSDEDNSREVAATKEVWGKSGISFDSSNEEEVVARLSNRKIAGKKRSKKHRQTRIGPCIQGRTLATRLLRFTCNAEEPNKFTSKYGGDVKNPVYLKKSM